VIDADLGLTFIDAGGTPHLVAAFGAGQNAAGAPLLQPSAAGFVALQLVQNYLVPGPDALLRCTAGGCASLAQLPLSGAATLLASPSFATDNTLVAAGAGGVAVSRDGGLNFERVSTEPMAELTSIPGPQGQRLVAVDLAHAQQSDELLSYSDDWGRTWHAAALGSGLAGGPYAHTPRQLAPGRLIASAADPRHPGLHVFVCSDDGASWVNCAGA
jgi:hypothetical protein